MKFSIEAWAPEYGTPMGLDEHDASTSIVDVTIENAMSKWTPVSPKDFAQPDTILFTDGVRRVDANVWITESDGVVKPGLCATYAAGAVLCDGSARIVAAEVERGLFTCSKEARPIASRHAVYSVRRPQGDSPDDLTLALQKRMADLEVSLATIVTADLTLIDGPLGARHGLQNTVGYVKTHHVSYLPEQVAHVIPQLHAGQRTPVFLIAGPWSRYSWYLRLPCPREHAWAGIVRCETTADVETPEVIALANMTAGTLPRFASEGHKDSRAPQNLYPIAGLERELRRRLGDPALLYRDLRAAAGLAATA